MQVCCIVCLFDAVSDKLPSLNPPPPHPLHLASPAVPTQLSPHSHTHGLHGSCWCHAFAQILPMQNSQQSHMSLLSLQS
jgi:hypothetical protein